MCAWGLGKEPCFQQLGRKSHPLCDTIPGPCLENPWWFVAPKLTTFPAPTHLPLSLGVHLDLPTPAFPRAWVYLVLVSGSGIAMDVASCTLWSKSCCQGLPENGKQDMTKCYFEMVMTQRWWTWGEAVMMQPFTLLGHCELSAAVKVPCATERLERELSHCITWLCFSTLIFSSGKYFRTV